MCNQRSDLQEKGAKMMAVQAKKMPRKVPEPEAPKKVPEPSGPPPWRKDSHVLLSCFMSMQRCMNFLFFLDWFDACLLGWFDALYSSSCEKLLCLLDACRRGQLARGPSTLPSTWPSRRSSSPSRSPPLQRLRWCGFVGRKSFGGTVKFENHDRGLGYNLDMQIATKHDSL